MDSSYSRVAWHSNVSANASWMCEAFSFLKQATLELDMGNATRALGDLWSAQWVGNCSSSWASNRCIQCRQGFIQIFLSIILYQLLYQLELQRELQLLSKSKWIPKWFKIITTCCSSCLLCWSWLADICVSNSTSNKWLEPIPLTKLWKYLHFPVISALGPWLLGFLRLFLSPYKESIGSNFRVLTPFA